jgi:hypothetical protein
VLCVRLASKGMGSMGTLVLEEVTQLTSEVSEITRDDTEESGRRKGKGEENGISIDVH